MGLGFVFFFLFGFCFFSESKQGFFKFGDETDEEGYGTCFEGVKVVDEPHKLKPGRCFHSTRELREARAVPLPTVGREPPGVRSATGG